MTGILSRVLYPGKKVDFLKLHHDICLLVVSIRSIYIIHLFRTGTFHIGITDYLLDFPWGVKIINKAVTE